VGPGEAPSRCARVHAAVTTVAILLLGGGGGGGVARGQGSTRATVAEGLFHDGRALIAEHRYKEACDKLASSQKLDPAVGTLLSLGECYLGQGKTASAWLSYRRAVALASERKDPRSAAAEERATAIEPQLSRLILRGSGEAHGGEVSIAVNGEALEREVLLEPMPIDPGPATIVVRVPGYRAWSTRAQVGPLGDTVTVLIPPLEPLPDPSEVAREHGRSTTKRVAGVALGGAGLVALGVGSILGLQAIVKIRDANQLCPGSTTCPNAGAVQENETGRNLADASSVVIPVGAALLGVGAFVFFTSRERHAPEVGADVSSNGMRLRVGWSW
jgi:hypothetical protein